MKSLYSFIVLFLGSSLLLIGQSITSNVIGNGGGTLDNGTTILDFTIGELMINTLTNNSVNLAQGFQQGKSSSPTIELKISSEGVTVITTIIYRNTATLGLDPGYDVGNFNGASFDIYTHLVDGSSTSNFTYQALPNSNYDAMVIPIGLKANAGKEVVFSIKKTNLPANLEIFIEDKELKNYVLLDETTNYTVSLDNAQDGIGRFYLHTRQNQLIWNGNTNSNWLETTNWKNNSVPINTSDVLIENTINNPKIEANTNVSINNLRINNSSILDVQSGGSITITSDLENNGNFTMTSTSTNSSTLIVKGTSNGQVTYERGGLKANVWSIVSAPVAGQSIKEFAENAANDIRINTSVTPNRYAIAYYDDSKPAGSKWVYYTTDDLATNTLTFEKGRSYAVSRLTNGSVTFTGTIETTDVAKSIVASEWNAIGNPYTAFLPINENAGTNFINSNVSKFNLVNVGVYVWDNAQAKYVGKSLITGESSLAPGQGFFVKAAAGVSNVTFNQSQRKVQPLTGGNFSKGGVVVPSIQLLATSKGVTIDTNIKYFENATEGLDPGYDLGNYARASFDVFTRFVGNDKGEDFTIQSLPVESIDSTVLPIGLSATAGA
ncbi:hypothetical protein F7018_11635, partial [Tenacibaculum aiptasiae]